MEGGSDPDPAVYCPANGYVPDEGDGTYIPPVVVPTPVNEDEIILLVTNQSPYRIYIRATVSSGSVNFEIYDMGGNLYDSYVGTTMNYYFPSGEDLAYYYIKITPVVPTAYFRTFQRYTQSNITTDWQIIYAKFNTPHIESLASAFAGLSSFRGIEFISTLNELTNLSSAFSDTNISKFVFPSSLSSLVALSSTFSGTPLITIDFNSCYLPVLSYLSNICSGCNKLKTAIINSELTSVTTLDYAFDGCVKLSDLTLEWGNLPSLAGTNCLRQTFAYCESIIELNLPACNPPSLYYTFQYMINLKKLTLNGDWVDLIYANSPMRYCNNLEEVILPTTINNSSTFSICAYCPRLKKVTFPDLVLSPENISLSNWFSNSQSQIEDFLGICETQYDETTLEGVYPQVLLDYIAVCRVFDKPLLKLRYLRMGINNGPLESVNINWSESFFGASPGSIALQIRGNLPSSEIDRIFNSLPILTDEAFQVDFRFCTGYPGCTPSIAEAKGWTVN